ncbi:MAG: hypothetical protein QRY72_02920 [Candidatus Rhabdochlamydia sp.]
MKNNYLTPGYTFVSPDGCIETIVFKEEKKAQAKVSFFPIHPQFLGFHIPLSLTLFNEKTILAQLGIKTTLLSLELSSSHQTAVAWIEMIGLTPLAMTALALLSEGMFVGKLFAADDRKRCTKIDQLENIFFPQHPLMTFHQQEGIALLSCPLLPHDMTYLNQMEHLLPVLLQALKNPSISLRSLFSLCQTPSSLGLPYRLDQVRLKQTTPLQFHSAYGRLAVNFLPSSLTASVAAILQPNSLEPYHTYTLLGDAHEEITAVPLEFYTLHPYQTSLSLFHQQDLVAALHDYKVLAPLFHLAPQGDLISAATFIVSHTQLATLKEADWITKTPSKQTCSKMTSSLLEPSADESLKQQPAYPLLQGIKDHVITSEGVLLTHDFPSPLLKQMLLSSEVRSKVKRIYFKFPSRSHHAFFSHEDRSLLWDLAKLGVSIYWVDSETEELLQYLPKPGKQLGMFVPEKWKTTFLEATLFGVYGSNLLSPDVKEELHFLFKNLLALKEQMHHTLFNAYKPLAIVSGGGPGIMELANFTARSLGILSCANIVDFSQSHLASSHEQLHNRYIDAKMTYRLENLIERQSEFHLDFPLFMIGGIGTDFEYALEEVRRKVGGESLSPILLFGKRSYWASKISSRFSCNLKAGTIQGSEWISNCFFCVQNGRQALEVYRQFFEGKLILGPSGQVYPEGFVPYSKMSKS